MADPKRRRGETTSQYRERSKKVGKAESATRPAWEAAEQEYKAEKKLPFHAQRKDYWDDFKKWHKKKKSGTAGDQAKGLEKK